MSETKRIDSGEERSITLEGFDKQFAQVCDPTTYYSLATVPSNIKVQNIGCAPTGTGSSICPWVDKAIVAQKLEAAIKAQMSAAPTVTHCGNSCNGFKLADFDRTQSFTGSDQVYLDATGKVVQSGPNAVSKITYDWSFDLRFTGEVGLCLAASAPMSRVEAK